MGKPVKVEKIVFPRFSKFLILLPTLMLLFVNTTQASQSKADVRILVDVSGSMKRNDPNNLRIPAVRLISGILPNGSKAGVWLFAEDVQRLSAVATVSRKSKKKIYALAKQIHNRGLFTNIGSALEQATVDWAENKSSDQRIVILLTDGVVDISKNKRINKQERTYVQEKLLPELKKLNARIYTIALSDDADKELLAQLSNSTDAWFEAVKTAGELEKIFLKIFEQSVNVPSLPITNNKFKVDTSINEFTALIFRNSSDPITLISPSGKKYEADTLGSKISWYEEINFDLVTITSPETGEWIIKGPVDPDNRVMVVSELSLDVNNDDLPANMLSGELLDLKVSLQEKGNIIKRDTFLSLINFSGEVSSLSGAIDEEIMLEDNGVDGDFKAGDGVFSFQFKAPKIDEEVTFNLRISSPTFERIYHRSLRVFSTYVKFQTTIADAVDKKHRIEIQPLTTVVDVQTVNAKGVLKLADGSELELEFSKGENGNLFTEILADNFGGSYTALLDIDGETLSGKKFQLVEQVVSFEAPAFEVKEPLEAELLEETEPEKTEKESQQKEKNSEKSIEKENNKSEVKDVETGLSSMWWIIIGIVFNVMLFVGGFFAWKLWKKRQLAAGDDLVSALDLDDEKENKKTDKKPDEEDA